MLVTHSLEVFKAVWVKQQRCCVYLAGSFGCILVTSEEIFVGGDVSSVSLW